MSSQQIASNSWWGTCIGSRNLLTIALDIAVKTRTKIKYALVRLMVSTFPNVLLGCEPPKIATSNNPYEIPWMRRGKRRLRRNKRWTEPMPAEPSHQKKIEVRCLCGRKIAYVCSHISVIIFGSQLFLCVGKNFLRFFLLSFISHVTNSQIFQGLFIYAVDVCWRWQHFDINLWFAILHYSTQICLWYRVLFGTPRNLDIVHH